MGRVILIVLDGLRPDAVRHPVFEQLKAEGSWTDRALSLDPPITFPVHVSLFTGLLPSEHGFTDNTAPKEDCGFVTVPEIAFKKGLKTAWFADWEPFLHIVKREALSILEYTDPETLRHTALEDKIHAQIAWTERAAEVLRSHRADFLFFHYMLLDHMGHRYGWMSEPYLAAADLAGECVGILADALEPDDTFIVMSDHGGHGTDHFDPDDLRDMTVPLRCVGRGFSARTELMNVSLIDIAPTLAELMRLDGTFRGRSLINNRL